MRIVITGASGNIGTGLLRALARDEEEHRVVGVCRRLPEVAPPFDTAEWRCVDVGGPDAEEELIDVFTGADAVVHLAWAFQPVRDTLHLHRTNHDGTAAVLRAVRAAGVPHLVHGSSIGVYAEGATEPVDESWTSTGISTSVYGKSKAEAERMIEGFAAKNPGVVVTSVRPTLVAQRRAAASLIALFFDPIVPRVLIRFVQSGRLPLLPLPAGFKVQLVHADDVGDALVRILRRRASGPFNLAADVLTIDDLAEVVKARPLPVPVGLVRGAVWLAWQLRAIRMSPGWFDVGSRTPLVLTNRAHDELGWAPRVSSAQAAAEQLAGMADGTDDRSPVLRRDRMRTEPARAYPIT
ncbi:NAD-dependent epimerase/dehydratase family protein [Umezawaea beigongshangensis]|uniref:NAD-dependent epimerase/dehydratase family protein n=1 Tax=Umezawaea beigongshangensis TaxID=2780383 RepID=UPI0018F1FA63|nr:NAD-dependent epimerase/dehydratase family protein [Umezawaea beigongshangensis]